MNYAWTTLQANVKGKLIQIFLALLCGSAADSVKIWIDIDFLSPFRCFMVVLVFLVVLVNKGTENYVVFARNTGTFSL